MEAKEITKDVYMHSSVADVILSRERRKWARWVLRKLIPEDMWHMPPISVCKLEAGTYIGKVVVHTYDLKDDMKANVDIGGNYGR